MDEQPVTNFHRAGEADLDLGPVRRGDLRDTGIDRVTECRESREVDGIGALGFDWFVQKIDWLEVHLLAQKIEYSGFELDLDMGRNDRDNGEMGRNRNSCDSRKCKCSLDGST